MDELHSFSKMRLRAVFSKPSTGMVSVKKGGTAGGY